MSNPILWGMIGGLVSASATSIGSLASLLKTRRGLPISAHLSMDFALGMMLSASAVSLLLPAAQSSIERGNSAVWLAAMAFTLGVFFIFGVGKLLHNTPSKLVGGAAPGAWLFVVAMMLHNLPEGLASGAALAGLDLAHGLPILGAIALQNLPEGLATVLAFVALGLHMRYAVLGGLASGLVELFGGIVGGLALSQVANILPYLLAFAGGAMLFVSTREAYERWASAAKAKLPRVRIARDLAFGAVVMAAFTLTFQT